MNSVLKSLCDSFCGRGVAQPATDLSITKIYNPGGDFAIVVTNNGPLSADGARVFDLLPPGAVVTAIDLFPGVGIVVPHPTATLAELLAGLVATTFPPGTALVIHIYCDVSAVAVPYYNAAFVVPPPGMTDSDYTNNFAQVQVNTVPCCMELENWQFSPSPVPGGATFTVSVDVRNCGDGEILEATGTLSALPTGASFNVGGGPVVTAGPIAPGSTATLTWTLINAGVTVGGVNGTFLATVTAPCGSGTMVESMESPVLELEELPDPVSPVGSPPDCCVNIDSIVINGGNIVGPESSYDIVVTLRNCGPDTWAGTGTLECTVLPSGHTITSVGGSVQDIDPVASGGTFEITYTVDNESALYASPAEVAEFLATVSCGDGDVTDEDAQSYPEGEVMSLNVFMAYDGGTITPEDWPVEDPVEFYAAISQGGPEAALGVTATAGFPLNFVVDSISVTYAGMAPGVPTLSQAAFEAGHAIGDMPASASVDYAIVGHFTATSLGGFTTIVATPGSTPPVDNNTADNTKSLGMSGV
jgi:hypothetical protein